MNASEIWMHGCRFDPLSEDAAVQHVIDELSEQRGGWMVTANLDHLRRMAWGRNQYDQLCSGAELIVADGMPLIWASRIRGTQLPERVAGSNLVWSLSKAAADSGRSIFLLGGAGDSAHQAGQVLKQHYPSLRIAGEFSPPLGFERDADQMRQIHHMIAEQKPDIVYVALGSPKQEQFISQLRTALPRAWWLGIGISFSFVSGEIKRPPQWMQRIGLEWLGRLAQEPGRLWKRYLVHDLPFAVVLLAGACHHRFAAAPARRRAA